MTAKQGTEAPAPFAPLIDMPTDFTTRIVCAYLANNQVARETLPDLIATVRAAITMQKPAAAVEATPAVPVKKSLGDDFIICLEDGKRLTMLKRYLWSQYGMTPEDYRRKWGLPHDYPMVAPAYARLRSQFAKKIGLGTVGTSRRAAKKAAAK